jgi:DNA mismatch repair protein MutL
MEVDSPKTLVAPKPKVELQNLFEDVYVNEVKVKEEPVTYITEEVPVIVKEEKQPVEVKSTVVEQEVKVEKKNTLPDLKVIGQLHGKYILPQGEQGLYIIDQHAAQEKYNYEVFKNAISKQSFTMQPLLMPIVLEISLSQAVRIEEMNEQLSQIGIQFEPFGNNTVLCRELPNWIQKVEIKEFLQDMIDLYNQNKTYTIDEIRKEAIASLACHYSIKFNRHLSNVELQQVIDDLGKCDEPYHCPHGRPTLICISEKQLIKEFKRG